ncbi:unnamed protein product [Pocillopora meandrina]|uniref:Uncharacterized protein n=1 Tax=Pocillopora meandrina TaxID=46732 RepID=A0AAU9XM62_9CNID|nr:unnamed protein product [Pocillopora meandrina]
MLENAPSYIGWFVDNIRNEKVTKSPISQNKAALKKYVESFQEGRDVVALKKKQREDKEPKKQHNSPQPSQNSASKKVVSPLAAGLASGHISTEKFLPWVASTTGVEKFKPTILVSVRKRKPKTPSATVTSTSTCTQDVDDEELCAFADQIEDNLVQPTSEPNISQQLTPGASQSIQAPEPESLNQGTGFCIKCYQYFTLLMMKICYSSEHSLLPDGWLKTLPKAGHLWVSQALFTTNNKGKAKLDFSR